MTGSEDSGALSTAPLLAGLNAAQREAALALVGPVCILAGAGTGKTRTITHRIAYGIREGVYDPRRVLALTFTTKAAGELRGRLHGLGAQGVQARTFHSAALSQLSYFWPHVIGGTAPRIIRGKSHLIAEAGQSIGIRLDQATVRDVAAEIEWRKVRELDYDGYGLAARSTRILPPSIDPDQMIDLMRAYEHLKDERRQMDFEDVLLATAGMLELEPWVTQQVREQYRFFVVDEFQDVSPLQFRLLELWLGDRRDVCVVGDAAQTIYSFAGASSEYLTGFERRFPDARMMRLEGNYRSSTAIIDVANALASRIPHSLTLQRVEETPSDGVLPEVLEFHDETDEARGVTARILEELRSGTKPEEIAVLYRTNVQAAALERALQDAEVPVTVFGQRPFFDLPEVKQAITAIRAATMAEESSTPLFQSVSRVLHDLGWRSEPPAAAGALRDRWNAWEALIRLADAAPAGTTLREFSAELSERARLEFEPVVGSVTLSSMHAAKGLEWESVTVVGVNEGLVPIAHAKRQDELDEERRLFYVAITRAKRRLRVTHYRFGGRREGVREPSRFLADLGSRIRRGLGSAPASFDAN